MKYLLLLLPLALVGCATDECETALADIQDKARECKLSNAEFIDEPTSEHQRTCDANDANVLTKQARCTRNASCAALDGSDTAANRAYTDCLSGP